MSKDLWLHPSGMNDAAAQAGRLRGLPTDVAALARVVQGLLMHLHVAPSYGLEHTPQQQAQAHLRSAGDILGCIVAQDARDLTEPRPAAERVVGVCRHFTLLHVALLRAHGIAARARCGFATYFEKGMFLDHWVTEYRDVARDRWVLVDPQLDDHQRRLFRIDFDTLDVPRDRLAARDLDRLHARRRPHVIARADDGAAEVADPNLPADFPAGPLFFSSVYAVMSFRPSTL